METRSAENGLVDEIFGTATVSIFSVSKDFCRPNNGKIV